jgi:hypothetical protein
MEAERSSICLSLTPEEAEELLERCLSSQESDTPAFQQAQLKLARATFSQLQESQAASSRAA